MHDELICRGSMRSPEPEASTGLLPWRALLDQATAPMALLAACGCCLHVNEALCGLLGYDRDGLLDGGLSDLEYLEAESVPYAEWAAAFADRFGGHSREKRLVRSDGRVVWVRQHTSVIARADGRDGMLLSQFEEIDDPRQAETLWCRAFANAAVGMALLDLRGCWTAVNDAWCEILGYSRDEMLSMCYSDVTYADDLDSSAAALADLVEGRVSSVTFKKRYRHKDGHPLWVRIHTSVVPGADDRPTYLLSQCEELSGRCMTDERLAHLALHDPLTGLANRALFADRLEHHLAELARDGGAMVVVVVDLDELKPVNDRFGHAAGDRFLVTAADELLNAVGPGDTVARLGGDEFAVVSRVPNAAAARDLRDRIEQRLRTECVVPGYRLAMSASVGLALTDDSRATPEDLLHRADQDMYTRKKRATTQLRPSRYRSFLDLIGIGV